MSIVVQKYGGSSVSTIENIEMVANRILETVAKGYQVVAVVSAMGNTTNELISLAKMVAAAPPKRELDLLISVGERVSMSLLAMALEKKGFKARSFTGSQSGIITDEHHGAAKIIEVKPERIQQALQEGCIAIVAGFQGMSRQREVTTLGRGGSDTTAVALTAALKAECCEICSDVSGVYSTDPRLVENAQFFKEMSLPQALAMAKNGAKVLQMEALEWSLKAGIHLVANATNQPFGQGTILKPALAQDLPAIAFDQQVLLLKNPDVSQLQEIFGGLRHIFAFDGQQYCIVDTRNIHQQIIGIEIATVTIIGDLRWEMLLKWTKDERVQAWWFNHNEWHCVVSREDVPLFVKDFHQDLYMC